MYDHPLRFTGTHDSDAIRGILIPVDGSEGALRATAHVIRSVSHRGACEIHLLNVQPPLMAGDIGPLVTVEMILRERLLAGHEALCRARALLDTSGTPCTTAIHFGKPAETIVQYARDHGIGAIVMGTRGMGALKNFLLGSVATKVVGSADIPVTLVKGDPQSRRLGRGGSAKVGRSVIPAAVRGGARAGSRNELRAA